MAPLIRGIPYEKNTVVICLSKALYASKKGSDLTDFVYVRNEYEYSHHLQI